MGGELRAQAPQVDLASLVSLFPDASLAGGPTLEPPATGQVLVRGIELDSRQVLPGQVFAALPGHRMHGIRFAKAALASGAAAILTDPDGLGQLRQHGLERVPVLVSPDPRAILGPLSARLYGNPAERLTMLGITGTNGKTTVASMIAAGLESAGQLAGTIGTVGVSLGAKVHPVSRTTPEAPHLQSMLAAMAAARVRAVALEVSSHALCEHRVDGIVFEVSVFTNLSQDHLDYHGTMDDYFQAKATLFTPERTAFAVICVDDAWGLRLAQQAPVPGWTCSTTGQPADWRLGGEPGAWWIDGPDGERQPLSIPLAGRFNLANALCAYACLRRIGVPGPAIAAGLAQVRVPGRMEPIGSGSVRGIVDYAHSPDAIEAVIASVREQSAGRILVVLGAGGQRDQGKRPLMGSAAARLADVVLITDDNPRSEDPASIRSAIHEGATSVTNGALASGAAAVAEVLEVAGRAAAIEQAVRMARPGEVVLVLGKGHEQGQEIGGVVHPFDDREVLRAALDARPDGSDRSPGATR